MAAGQNKVSLQYTNTKATAVTIVSDCKQESIVVRLKDSEVAILGEVKIENGVFTFIPAFPFSSNYTYEVVCDDQLIDTFSPKSPASDKPYSVSVFPSQDTVPENLLKMHFVFSQPMSALNSYAHIQIWENGIEIHPFLELESELWNQDRTVFTVWLDPGRIKRDLTPNKLYGNPLTKGNTYILTIDSVWRSQDGTSLDSKFRKEFFVGNRDENLPSPGRWKITAHSNEINITFDEPLDYLLLQNSLTLWKDEQRIRTHVKNTFNVGVTLIPEKKLLPGVYFLKVDAKLEDLAGNNLTRPFDQDLYQSITREVEQIKVVVKE